MPENPDDLISKRFLSSIKKIGIESLEELLLYLPKKYKDYRSPEKGGILEAKEKGGKHYLKLKMTRNPEIEYSPGKPGRVKIQFTDGITNASSMVFGNTKEWTNVKSGSYIFVVAEYAEFNNWPQLQKLELIPAHHQGRIVPFYTGKEKVVSPITIGQKMAIALRVHLQDTVDFLCEKIGVTEKEIIQNTSPKIDSIGQIIYLLHRPSTTEEIMIASKAVRMINAYYAMRMSMSNGATKENKDSEISYSVDLIKSQLKKLPFDLTDDQRRAIWEVTKDLGKDKPMNRLLSGDVGCGKTIAYAVPAVCSYLENKNVVIIMPNLLLAVQVATEITESFPDADVTLMLGGKDRPKNKLDKKTIIVGTTAILFWLKDINYEYKADLLIIDEQQKLGQAQKDMLMSEHTNLLESTATAIPKTAAAVLYGDKKISLIEECPVDKSIKTIITGIEHRTLVFDKLMEITRDGSSQVAVLYPLRKSGSSKFDIYVPIDFFKKSGISESGLIKLITEAGGEIDLIKDILPDESSESWQPDDPGRLFTYRIKGGKDKKVISSLSNYEEFGLISLGESQDSGNLEKCKRSVESASKQWEKHFPGQVVMIHGGLTVKEKLHAIDKAKSGNCKVIVTSSVIEIGLTMPDLRGLLIIESNNYGASTLHQFRGRLARKGGKGLFIMSVNKVLSELDPDSIARLNLLVRFNKGSLIAENDMKQRGFGDLSGASSKQAGFFDGVFKGIKMIPQDIEELLEARLSKD